MAHILMVDDDELMLQVTGDYLVSLGHSAERCDDPTRALERVEKTSPDLAIVDYEMPRLTGTQLLTALRGAGHMLPVIFLSGFEALRYTSKVPPDPRVRFLQKPVDYDDLRGAISALLDPEGWSAKS
jgi:DNA-binding NtrC family response regulator